ncbi:biliverdin-producing heme oxygenase [Rhodococcus rhodnii]|uniref:Heme oxygenase n=2 Tax=Rhodococcus rhodnii TaxID=38312 RepID=R7WW98_9NOCA|nr:biliverdin-producing heme oxygenase [Rhodococcus rhodnii]EOM78414.1 heme oxygenase [Rhodococcus rhodnii LMG 5362]TXG91231.1 biliverdin-producing heme oxygenase [Rhodococcus rhodnii]
MSTIPHVRGLSERLRTDTADAHRQAEESGFVDALLAGELPIEAYAELLAQSYLIYEALERVGAESADDPIVAEFLADELLRVPALEADLAHLRGAGWRETLTALPATARYVERIESARTDPAVFVAHHYIRYLGDLSGGQIIRRKVGDAYGLTGDGVRFYIFDEIPKPKPFKDAYRASLDAAPFDDLQAQRIVDEVTAAYELNRALFADLDEFARR